MTWRMLARSRSPTALPIATTSSTAGGVVSSAVSRVGWLARAAFLVFLAALARAQGAVVER
ncbi:MAG: hypothetical protein AAGE43_01190 [Pseudomonadota bacterium]